MPDIGTPLAEKIRQTVFGYQYHLYHSFGIGWFTIWWHTRSVELLLSEAGLWPPWSAISSPRTPPLLYNQKFKSISFAGNHCLDVGPVQVGLIGILICRPHLNALLSIIFYLKVELNWISRGSGGSGLRVPYMLIIGFRVLGLRFGQPRILHSRPLDLLLDILPTSFQGPETILWKIRAPLQRSPDIFWTLDSTEATLGGCHLFKQINTDGGRDSLSWMDKQLSHDVLWANKIKSGRIYTKYFVSKIRLDFSKLC